MPSIEESLAEYRASKEQPETKPAEDKGLLGNAWDDVWDTIGNYATGAKQGYQEMIRRGNDVATNNPIALTGTPMEDGVTNAPAPPQNEEQKQEFAQYGKAVENFGQETVKPAVGTAALVAAAPVVGTAMGTAGTVAGAAYLPFLASDVIKSAKQGGIGQAARDLTYGPAVDFINQPNLAQQFYKKPVSTTGNALMSILPLALFARGLHDSLTTSA